MNDTNEPRDDVAASYDRLRASVEPTVAVEPALDDLHATTSRRAMPRGWSVAAVGLSAAAVLAVAFMVVGGPDEQPTASAPTQAPPATAAPEDEPPSADDRCDPQIFVYVEPTATPEVVDGIRAQLAMIDPAGEWSYLDRETTYQQYERLFAGLMLDGLPPDEWPTSFRREVREELASIDVVAINAIPGTTRFGSDGDGLFIDCSVG